MKGKLVKQIYDKVDNQWLFIVEAAAKYKEEFKKTSKIGQPPKIDDVLLNMVEGGAGEDKQKEEDDRQKSGGEEKNKTEDKKEKTEGSGKAFSEDKK